MHPPPDWLVVRMRLQERRTCGGVVAVPPHQQRGQHPCDGEGGAKAGQLPKPHWVEMQWLQPPRKAGLQDYGGNLRGATIRHLRILKCTCVTVCSPARSSLFHKLRLRLPTTSQRIRMQKFER